MSETYKTTNNIETLTTALSSTQYALHSVITDSDSFPYSTIGDEIIGISISNNTSAVISIVITDINDAAITIPISGNKNFESTVTELKSINTSATSSFSIALLGRI